MNVIFEINGQKAIPVRAIPFVTGWSMSPDVVASSLARTDLTARLRAVSAFHFDGNGAPAPMLPKEWDGIEAELQTLSDTLKAREVFDSELYPTWQRESILLLPAGVFVWKDEFVIAFSRAYSKKRMSILGERSGDRQLNLTPLIPQALREAVVEGFSAGEMPAVQARGDHQTEIDPSDLPHELDAANIAFRAVVMNGHGDPNATPRNRIIDFLKTTYPTLNNEASQRIATVANPNKGPGRKKSNAE